MCNDFRHELVKWIGNSALIRISIGKAEKGVADPSNLAPPLWKDWPAALGSLVPASSCDGRENGTFWRRNS